MYGIDNARVKPDEVAVVVPVFGLDFQDGGVVRHELQDAPAHPCVSNDEFGSAKGQFRVQSFDGSELNRRDKLPSVGQQQLEHPRRPWRRVRVLRTIVHEVVVFVVGRIPVL